MRLPLEHAPAAYAASVRGARAKIEEMVGGRDQNLEVAEKEAMAAMEKSAPVGGMPAVSTWERRAKVLVKLGGCTSPRDFVGRSGG